MGTFKTTDENGVEHTWEIGFTIGKFRQWKKSLALDLMNPNAALSKDSQETLLMVLQLDLSKFLLVLSQVLAPQLEKAGVTPDEFDDMLTPESLSKARDVFFAEYLGFFTRVGMQTVRAIMDKTLEALKEAEHQVRSMTISGNSSGNSLASSDSTAVS